MCGCELITETSSNPGCILRATHVGVPAVPMVLMTLQIVEALWLRLTVIFGLSSCLALGMREKHL